MTKQMQYSVVGNQYPARQ